MAAPLPASADDGASAESLFQSGMTDLRANRLETACPALRKSYRLDARPVTLFHLAECEEKAGRLTTAALHYDDYLTLFDHLSPSEQKQEHEREQLASARREALEREMPRVTLVLSPSAPLTTRVTRIPPGSTEPVQLAVGVPLPIDPGEHVVSTEAPGRPRWSKSFVIKKGEQKTVELEVAPPDDTGKTGRVGEPVRPVPAVLPPLDPGVPAQRVVAYVVGGVGVLSVVAGFVTGSIAWGQKGTIESNCDEKKECNEEGLAATHLADGIGVASTVTFAVGLAAVATSVVLFLTEPEPKRIGRAPSGVVVGLGAGPGRTSLEVRW